MQLRGLLAGNRTHVLWIARPVLYHWATEAIDNESKSDKKDLDAIGYDLKSPLWLPSTEDNELADEELLV